MTTTSARLSAMQGVDRIFAAGVVLLLAAFCWAPNLPTSLWLDETLTYWVVRDGLGETLERTLFYQPQPGYYVFMWFWTQLAGTSEVALRLPSLVAALAACFAMARLGEALTRDRETGVIAALVFASTWNVYRESVDARSYMLGVLGLVCLGIVLVRWTRTGGWRDASLVGALGGLLVNLQVFFVLVYPALALYAAMRWRAAPRRLAEVALIGALLLLGALLFLPVGMMLLEHGGDYSFVPRPTWRVLFEVFAWGAPIAGLLAGLCASGLLGRLAGDPQDEEAGIDQETGTLLAVWMLLPMIVLFAISMLTEMSIFLGRYLIPAIPAVSIFYAIALRRIGSGLARYVAVLVMIVAAVVSHDRPHDDFRGATLAVNEFVAGDSGVPVLLASGLIEGEEEGWLRDPVLARYLNAPAEYYALDGRLVTSPRRLAGHAMTDETIDPILDLRDRFVAIEWYANGARILPILSKRAEQRGYRVVRKQFGGVRVMFFRFAGG